MWVRGFTTKPDTFANIAPAPGRLIAIGLRLNGEGNRRNPRWRHTDVEVMHRREREILRANQLCLYNTHLSKPCQSIARGLSDAVAPLTSRQRANSAKRCKPNTTPYYGRERFTAIKLMVFTPSSLTNINSFLAAGTGLDLSSEAVSDWVVVPCEHQFRPPTSFA